MTFISIFVDFKTIDNEIWTTRKPALFKTELSETYYVSKALKSKCAYICRISFVSIHSQNGLINDLTVIATEVERWKQEISWCLIFIKSSQSVDSFVGSHTIGTIAAEVDLSAYFFIILFKS